MAKSVAHISGERLQNADQDAYGRIEQKIDTQRRETLAALPKVCSRHIRRHYCFLALSFRLQRDCGQFGDSKSRRILPPC